MGLIINGNEFVSSNKLGAGHNIGDIFYTTRTDNSLNGAVECNGSQYNFSDFDSNLQALLDNGSIPSVSIGEFDSMVSEKGWCDKIGYGTNELIIYPVKQSDGSTIFCYTNITNWYEVERDYYDKLLNVKVYDKDTHEELVGYYVIYVPETDCFYVYNNSDENVYGSDVPLFPKRNGEPITLPTGGEFQTTTYFKVPKLSAYIIQKENIPVIGNGMSLGLTKGTTNVNLQGNSSGTVSVTVGQYGNPVGSPYSAQAGVNSSLGITTDPEKSGIISDLSNDSFTGRVMIQLFNSTTDTAVATCNQVLADVSALNQGDYVIETQLPTEENNYSWYRLYKSGWVEQGCQSVDPGSTWVLPIAMANDKYTLVTSYVESSSTLVPQWAYMGIEQYSTHIIPRANGLPQRIYICGMSAQGNN